MKKEDTEAPDDQENFEILPGIRGKVFIPSTRNDHPKKHPCNGCFSCQNCGDERCRICRKKSGAETP